MDARDLAKPDEAQFDETGVKRTLTGWAARLVAGVALAFSTYQLIIAAYAPLSSLPTRSIHVGFLLGLSFLITIWPARSAARLDPVEALRYE